MSPSPPSPGESAPLLVRIAGLPVDAMESFHSDLCASLAQESLSLHERLVSARAEMADQIFGLIRGASPDVRRVLLRAKRDCFNGRPLLCRRGSTDWAVLRELVGPSADRVVDLEEAEERLLADYLRAYESASAREHEAIASLSTKRGLLRGVTLASPALVENLPRFTRGLHDKRQARLDASLVRYVSRAALKTSPFSTLTRLSFGVVTSEPVGPGAVELIGASWKERSRVRFKRYIPDQDYALLCHYPPFRDRLRVALNSSLWESTPGHYVFVRPSFWAPSDASMRYTAASLVQLDLSGPLVAWLLRELTTSTPLYAELVETLEHLFAKSSDDRRVRDTLVKLFQIGFLRLLPPWPSNEGHLEKRMLEHLRSLPSDPRITPFVDTLERLVALQDGYAESQHPLGSLHEMDRLVDTLWQSSRLFAPGEPSIERHKFSVGALYEDVFLEGSIEGDPWRPVLKLSQKAVEGIVRSARPLVRVTQLFSHRHELLHAVTAFGARQWQGRREVGLVEFMRDIQPLWRSYGQFLAETSSLSGASQRAASFNPFKLDAVRALERLREEVWSEIERGIRRGDEEGHIESEALEAILARVPARYLPTLDACLMLQPADAVGERWVLNQLFEGTGRYGSRYTNVMPPALRERYAAHFAERSYTEGLHGRADFLDLVFSFGETLNLHAVQTPSVLEMLDESLDASASRKLSLRELSVRFDGPDDPPRIVDGAGRSYAPVHLGVADQTFMPFIVRLLSLFGPDELRKPRFPERPVQRGEVTIWPRVVVGQIVTRRRRWTLPARALPEGILRAPTKQSAFAALNRWRITHEIPERVFVTEHIRDDLYKPQFIDFTSPLFAQIFLSIAGKDEGSSVSMEEMLPTPDAAPADGDGRRWVVELQLDTLALRPFDRANREDDRAPDPAASRPRGESAL